MNMIIERPRKKRKALVQLSPRLRNVLRSDSVQHVENKTKDIIAEMMTLPGAGRTFLINGVAQGNGVNQRDGIHCTCTSVQMKWFLHTQADQATTGIPVYYKVMLIYDQSPNTSNVNISDIFTESTPNAFIVTQYSSRFLTVAKTKVMLTAELNAGSNDPIGTAGEIYAPVSLPVQYNGNGSGIAAITKGALYLVLLVAYNGVVSTDAAITVSIRYNFTDSRSKKVITHRGKSNIMSFNLNSS